MLTLAVNISPAYAAQILLHRSDMLPDRPSGPFKHPGKTGSDGPLSSKTSQPSSRRLALRALLSKLLFGACIITLDWWLHGTVRQSQHDRVKSYTDTPCWLEDTTDDFFFRNYVQGLRAVGNLNVLGFFTGMCERYRFDDSWCLWSLYW